MYADHEAMILPENPNVKIWRYLDFTKFVSLIDQHALFFARASVLEDAFEGSYSQMNIKLRPVRYKDVTSDLWKVFSIKVEQSKKFMLINSWHMNDCESAAMWEIYAKNNQGIAIQSTYNRLKDSFKNTKDDVYISTVIYADYTKDIMPEGNMFYPFMYKRKSFDFERELRAMILRFPPTEDGSMDFNIEVSDSGDNIPVDLDTLIEQIYVSPTAPKWTFNLVKSVMSRYGLDEKLVRQSNLLEQPVY